MAILKSNQDAKKKTGSKGDVYFNTLRSQQHQEHFLSVKNGLF